MSVFAICGIALFAAVIGAATVRAAARGAWGTAAGLAAAAVFGILLATASAVQRPLVVAIVVDQPVGANPVLRQSLGKLLARLRTKGLWRVALVEVAGAGGPGDVRFATADAGAGELARTAARAADLPAAVAAAAAAVGQEVAADGLALLRGTGGRVVVAVSDVARWDDFAPLDVDGVLTALRQAEATLDVVAFDRSPAAARVEVTAPLGLPAGKPLDKSGARIYVTVRSPLLEGSAGPRTVEVSGTLDGPKAVLPKRNLNATAGANGALSFALPASAFVDATDPKRIVSFAAGFARADLAIRVLGGTPFDCAGVGYLPVRRTDVWVAAGPGGPQGDRLLVPRPLDPEPPATSDVDRLKMRSGALNGVRTVPAVHFDPPIDEAQLTNRLKDPGQSLPAVLVLHEMSPAFWSSEVIKRLTAAVNDGMHLMVIAPPVAPPVAADAEALRRLLPALARPDGRPGKGPAPRTVARDPVLLLVFDYGRLGTFEEDPLTRDQNDPGGAARKLADGLGVQLAAAQALLKEYRDAGLVFGTLQRQAKNVIAYAADPKDRVVVRVAPKLSTPDDLTATLLPSALELRVAAAMAGDEHFPLERAKTGLPGPSPTPLIPLAASPAETPALAVVAFAADVPQPGAAAVGGPAQVPVAYTLAGSTAAHSYARNPDGALAVPLLQGGSLAVVRLTAPKYNAGLQQMTTEAGWTGTGPAPFRRFGLTLQQVLTTKLANDLKELGQAGAFPLMPADAAKRLLAGSAGPFLATIELTGTDPVKQARQAGQAVAARTLELHRSPRAQMTAAALGYDRFIDGRVPHGLTAERHKAIQATAAGTAPDYPAAATWAAPRRYRVLEESPPADYPEHARGVFVAGIEGGPAATRRPPVPLMVGGVAGNGVVAVLAYSPFETAESWWGEPQDCILNLTDPRPGALGDQRLIDFANLTSRVRPPAARAPVVREVNALDARGALEIVCEFLPARGGADPAAWQPTVHRTDPPTAEAKLDLTAVLGSAGEVRYRLRPEEAAKKLFPAGAAWATVGLHFGSGAPPRLVLKRPPGGPEQRLTAYQSAATVAGYSGGGAGAADALDARTRSLRTPWFLGLSVALTVLFAARSYWRWGHWLSRAARPAAEPPPVTNADIPALAQRAGRTASPPRPRKAPGEIDAVVRYRGGDPLDAATRQALIEVIFGIPTLLPLTWRTRPKALRVLVVVNCGRSMRVAAGGDRAMVAAAVAQFACETAWTVGAEVELRAVGVDGDCSWGPAVAADREGGVFDRVREWCRAGRPVAPTLAGLDATPGTAVVYVSDFLAEDLATELTWLAEVADQGGRAAAAMVSAAADAHEVGVGVVGPPWAVLERSVGPAEVARALDARRDEVRAEFRAANVPLAEVDAAMDGELMLAAVLESGMVAAMV